MTSIPIPRGSGCWLCHVPPLAGAPYAQRHELSLTPYATLASPAAASSPTPMQADAGADLRWTTPRGATLDATLWPDFSQVESDVPRIDTNARFALSHPEKRPFFMAGSELFATPIAGVYTRSISSPRFGLSGVMGFHVDETRVGDELLDAHYLSLDLALQPSRRVPQVSATGRLGEGVDTLNGSVGRGGALMLDLALRPGERLGLELHAEREWLNAAAREPLFSAQVLRLKAIWSFDARSYVRLIAQHDSVRRNPERYPTPVTAAVGLLEWSLLFAYRLGWRTSAFAGYAESGPDTDAAGAATSRQLFFKVAYELRR